MLRTIIWYIHFVVSAMATIPAVYRYRGLKKTLPEDEFLAKVEAYTSKWARAQLKYSGAKINITGLENIPREGAVLFVSNHQGNFDIAIFLGLIRKPKGYISKIEVLKMPVIRTWMKYMRCVFMDREDMRKSMQAIVDGVNVLKQGQSLVIFPEGTRSKGGPAGQFRPGSFKLAAKAGVPIIPVTMDGTYKIMEANGGRVRPAEVHVTIHPVVETKGISKEEEAGLPERVRAIILKPLPEE